MYQSAYMVDMAVAATASVAPNNPLRSTITGTAEWRWSPGYIPGVVRAVAVSIVSSAAFIATGTKPKLSVRRNVFGAASVSGDELDDIALTSGQAAGSVKFLDNLNITVSPGQEITIVPSVLATAVLTAGVQLFVETKHEVPGNITAMTETV